MCTSCFTGAAPRPLARLLSAAMLAMFLLAQPSTICLPLCWMGVHYEIPAATAHQHNAAKPCHTDPVHIQAPAPQSLGSMLPTGWAPPLLSIRIVSLETESPETLYLSPLSASDPPPPRSI